MRHVQAALLLLSGHIASGRGNWPMLSVVRAASSGDSNDGRTNPMLVHECFVHEHFLGSADSTHLSCIQPEARKMATALLRGGLQPILGLNPAEPQLLRIERGMLSQAFLAPVCRSTKLVVQKNSCKTPN